MVVQKIFVKIYVIFIKSIKIYIAFKNNIVHNKSILITDNLKLNNENISMFFKLIPQKNIYKKYILFQLFILYNLILLLFS